MLAIRTARANSMQVCGSRGIMLTKASEAENDGSNCVSRSGKQANSETQRTPVPDTRPSTIEGWTVREVTNGITSLEGPKGIWRVRRGDAVPGLGRIESIVSGAALDSRNQSRPNLNANAADGTESFVVDLGE
jgi:hypothetical protein